MKYFLECLGWNCYWVSFTLWILYWWNTLSGEITKSTRRRCPRAAFISCHCVLICSRVWQNNLLKRLFHFPPRMAIRKQHVQDQWAGAGNISLRFSLYLGCHSRGQVSQLQILSFRKCWFTKLLQLVTAIKWYWIYWYSYMYVYVYIMRNILI